jgi:tetraacyldisaccharide 4'-kinase
MFSFTNMPFWKILLWPLALLWGLGSALRNWMYDTEFLSSAEFEVPVISIGNLNMGGSGKTPHTEYFLYRFREILKMAVLSRGYRDEARQLKAKFRDQLIAVGESRALAIPGIMQAAPATELIILDDAYQHRSVKPALNILLTTYDLPFWKDQLFPVGWLREAKKNHKRADIIIVTKCPRPFTAQMQSELADSFTPMPNQKMFYTSFRYGTPYQFLNPANRREVTKSTVVLLFSGIAQGQYLKEELDNKAEEVIWMEYDDHYSYEQRDLVDLRTAFVNLEEEDKMIITTEKDVVRLEPYMKWIVQEGLTIYCQPVTVEFTGSNKNEFDNLVFQYINYYKSDENEDGTDI